MTASHRRTILFRIGLTAGAVTALFWTVWYLVFGSVSATMAIPMTQDWSYALPFVVYRWWDIPSVMLLGAFIVLIVTENPEDRGGWTGPRTGRRIGLRTGLRTGLWTGRRIGLRVGLCLPQPQAMAQGRHQLALGKIAKERAPQGALLFYAKAGICPNPCLADAQSRVMNLSQARSIY